MRRILALLALAAFILLPLAQAVLNLLPFGGQMRVAGQAWPSDAAAARALRRRVQARRFGQRRGRIGAAVVEAAGVAFQFQLAFAMAHAGELDSIDVNPLVVMDQGAVCLDAVITRKEPA